MHETQGKKWMISGLILAGFVLSFVAVFTEIPAGGADNYSHFNIARWAFRYPYLFFDHWGKPVFTILTAPFAQVGFLGVRIFNIFIGLLTAWIAYKLAIEFRLKHAWFAAVSVVFTPLYFVMMSSGMTEILFGFFLTISIFLFFKEKFIWAAFLISFIFLVRTEGVIFIPLFMVALLFKRQYKLIPFLFTGFFVFSLLGWIYYYHDFWWLINERPYMIGGPSVYGSGTWYHFFVKMPNYFGFVVSLLLIIGTVVLVLRWVKDKFSINQIVFFQILLILGCFWGYFLAHSYLWWRTENSAGLVRVMAGVSPLATVIGMFALNANQKWIQSKKITKWFFGAVLLILFFFAVRYYYRAVSRNLSNPTLKQAALWLKRSGSLQYKLVMHNPYFAFSTELDAWNTDVVQYGFSDNNFPENGLPDSTIFIWDAHFSANEGRIPLEKIMQNQNFELIKYFEPEKPFKVLGNNDYKILVFLKITNAGKNNYSELEKLKKEAFEKGIYYGEIYDFQQALPDEGRETKRLISEKDSSNWIYNLFDAEFSPEFVVQEEKFERNTKNRIRILLDICSLDSIGKNRLFMVCSTEKDFKSVNYEALDITEQINEINVWKKAEFIFKVPDKFPEDGIIKLYIWNIDKRKVLIDNFRFDIARQTNW